MKRKRITAAVTVLLLSLSLFITPAMAAQAQKTETVYASLNHDGSAKSIYVVNHLTGSYTDYGVYTEIKNLTTTSEAVVDGDKITFPDEPTEEGLYYQGTTSGELPMTFTFHYYLDGKEVNAESLAGAKGHLKIEMEYAPNPQCDTTVREGLMAQVSAVFNSGSASNVTSEDASRVTVGSSENMTFIIMPEQSGTMTIEADVNGFEMDPITMALMKNAFSIPGVTDSIGDFEDGMGDMLSGAGEMVDGTTELKKGMKTLAGKAGQLNTGLAGLSAAGVQMDDGMAQYESGLGTYIAGVQALKAGSADIRTGLDTVANNGSGVASGISAVSGNLSALAGGTGDLKALAESLAGSSDPSVQALADGVLQLIGSVQGVSNGLESASSGLSAYVQGVSQAAGGYHAFDDGVAAAADSGAQTASGYSGIRSGFTSYRQGVSQSAEGFNKLYLALRGLPSDVQQLIDGQIEFKDGIASAKDEIADKTAGMTDDGKPAISFASPEKNHPSSVQYILTTPGIKIVKTIQEEQTEEEGDFLSRFADLFN